MKEITRMLLIVMIFALSVSGCDDVRDFDDIPCGDHNGQPKYKEADGRCYYITNEGHKTYVEQADCDCDS